MMPLLLICLLCLIMCVTVGLVVYVAVNHVKGTHSKQRRALLLVDMMVTDLMSRPFRLPQLAVLTYRQGNWELGSKVTGHLTFPATILNAAAQADFVRFFDNDEELLIAIAILAQREATQAPSPPARTETVPAPVETPANRSTIDRLLGRDPLGGDENK